MISKSFSIFINSRQKTIYSFVSNPRNLPKWAKQFCLSVKKVRGKWVIDTPMGKVGIRFAKKNKLGVLDHFVRFKGKEVYAPMRVITHGKRSLVVFILFRQKGMTEKAFRKDAKMVSKDLKSLKRAIEG